MTNIKKNTFIYQSYSYKVTPQKIVADFYYSAQENNFHHQISYHFPHVFKKPPQVDLNTLIFHLGLVEIPTYWKAHALPYIDIECGHLTPSQKKFWHKLFIKGMGEFFYKNKIDFTHKNYLTLSSKPTKSKTKINQHKLKQNFILPIGGGKDSAVTLDKIMRAKKSFVPIAIYTTSDIPAINQTLKAVHIKKYIKVKRNLDPKILNPNKHNYLQGHVPFSASLAFITTTAAIITQNRYIAFSNESSSNQGNVVYKKHSINHQYSKSFEFEQDFHQYAQKYLHPQVYYFSYLRPFNELQISQYFSQLKHFHKATVSCNKGQKNATWCGSCPKCLSTYLMITPFSPQFSHMHFKSNLAKKKSLQPLLQGLLGQKQSKPFECVATFEETQAALDLLNQNNKNIDQILSLLTQKNYQHLIPKFLHPTLEIFTKPQTTPLIPVSKIAILGFGREGQSTLKYLLTHYKLKEISIVDNNPDIQAVLDKDFKRNHQTKIHTSTGKKYLKNLKTYHLIFKSPGISPHKQKFQHLSPHKNIITSHTQLFFETAKGTIIGVTGTKGKSTTTSLIHHVLKKNNIRAELVGNIGKPALEFLSQNSLNITYCFELSSYQLYDLHRSPHIAVIQNITPEHLDYHSDFNEYANAKLNIIKYQLPDDHLLYNQSYPWPKKAAAKTISISHPFPKSKPNFLIKNDIPLKGKFNYQNIWPSIIIGHIYNLTNKQIKTAIKNFQPLEHRLQSIATKNNIEFIDDSLSTTPVATIAALGAFNKKISTLILGGAERHQDFSTLIDPIKQTSIKTIILLPPTGSRIKKQLVSKLRNIKFFSANSMQEVIKLAFSHTEPNTICLLSTAAPSFGIFRDYNDKASQYKYWINQLYKNNKKI